MNQRKIVKPGDKRNISFPLNIDEEMLKYLNSQTNFSKALLDLAIKGFKSKNKENLEDRIEKLESIILKNENVCVPKINDDIGKNLFTFEKHKNKLTPEEEDDDF